MGKKGVLLDNGKQARSSMALYWNSANKRDEKDKTTKHEAPQEDIQTRAGSNLQKWKLHKQKLINKLYEKPQKKEKVDLEAEKQKERKQQQQLQRDLLEKQMNKNKPIHIPGFKNATQLKSKLQYEKVTLGKDQSNKLIPRGAGEELTHQDIVHILREKKAKKQLQRAQKQKVQKNLRQRQTHSDFMMAGFPLQKEELPKQKQPEQIPKEQVKEPEPPKTIFKSQLLQKIERGQSLIKKQQKIVPQQPAIRQAEQIHDSTQGFVPRFIPRALWNK